MRAARKNIFLQLRCDLTQGVDAVRLWTHYAFLGGSPPFALLPMPVRLLRAAFWVAASGKNGASPSNSHLLQNPPLG